MMTVVVGDRGTITKDQEETGTTRDWRNGWDYIDHSIAMIA